LETDITLQLQTNLIELMQYFIDMRTHFLISPDLGMI